MKPPRIHRVFTVGEHTCVVGENGLSFYIAYVFIPESHPWHGLHYDTIEELYEPEAHGGLTFSDERDFNSWDGVGDGAPVGWYVGMDFGHAWDAPIEGSDLEGVYRNLGGRIDLRQWDVDSVAQETRVLAVSAQRAVAVGSR